MPLHRTVKFLGPIACIALYRYVDPPLAPMEPPKRTEDDGIFGFLLFVFLTGSAGYGGYVAFKKWRAYEQKKFKDDMRAEIRKLKKDDDIKDLQVGMQKIDPSFMPGESARKSRMEALGVRQAVGGKLRAALQSPKPSMVTANPNSKDPVESLAADFGDPQKAEALRDWWEKLMSFEQADTRKLVWEKMGIYGIKWSKRGNPFEEE